MNGWTIALILLGVALAAALLLTLAGEYFLGSGVYAEYPGGVGFSGGGHFGRLYYYGVAWVRPADDPRPCPLVVHLAGGDLTGAEFADSGAMLARGWTSVTSPEQAATGLPLILIYREGDYAVNLSYAPSDGALTAVTVGVAGMGSAKPTARGIPVSLRDKRVSLPAPERELFEALGPPARRTRGAAY